MFNSSWGVDFTEPVGLKSRRDIKSRMDHRRVKIQEARDRFILRAFLGTWLVMALMVGSLSQSMPPSGRISDFRDPNVDAEDGWTVLFNGKDFAGWVPVLKQQEGTAKKYLEHEVDQQTTFTVKEGKILTTGKPSGYLRTEKVSMTTMSFMWKRA